MDEKQLWQRYRKYLCVCPKIDLMLDISRMHFDDGFFERMAEPMCRAYEAMQRLEAGEIANPDENRRVGHYWLRDASRAPNAEIREAIEGTLLKIERFAAEIHAGQIRPQTTDRFTDVLVIGIGGSALGPQLAADALGDPGADRMRMHFFDNTDPDGIDRVLRQIGGSLPSTLTLVISKGGSTPETRNGMILARKAYEQRDLDFVQHAVAVTGEGSALDKLAEKENWAHRLPMWDWVGGRTSQTAAVGLLPAALQGCDITALLDGAARCDQVTRATDTMKNPAALMALMWHHATNGRGEKDMVILPYKDRLQLFSRYLQQLVMESLGKGKDLDDKPVKQGIAVYGNKGSTDQHAYVQQLREGVDNFFATFIRVLEDGGGAVTEVESSVTAGDYLHGFLLGTREALYENDRQSLTITIERVDAFSLGVLIALFERAVGYYATLVNINAYHQPGVEAGKKAAASVLELQKQVVGHLQAAGQPLTADQIAAAIDRPQQVEHVLHILQHLAANGRIHTDGQADHPAEQRYSQ